MKRYDFKLAKKIIDTYKDLGVLETASMGMHSDWFWTADTVYDDNKYKVELNDDTEIGGINGSSWDTPVIQLELNNGETIVFKCYKGEWTSDVAERIETEIMCTSGPLSEKSKLYRLSMSLKEFKI